MKLHNIASIDTYVQINRRQVDYTKLQPALVQSFQQRLKYYSEFLVSTELFFNSESIIQIHTLWKIYTQNDIIIDHLMHIFKYFNIQTHML